MPPFLRLIRVTKAVVLTADILTVFCAAMLIGWQATLFLRDGYWPALPVSAVFGGAGGRGAQIVATASVAQTDVVAGLGDLLLRVPSILPLLLAIALLSAFWCWLAAVDRKYLKD